MAQLNLGLAYQFQGNARAAAEVYRQMIDFCLNQGILYLAFAGIVNLIEVCLVRGCLYEAQALCDRLQDMEHLPGGSTLALSANGAICLGRLYYERNDLATTERMVVDAINQIWPGAQPQIIMTGWVTLAQVHQARGEWAAAFQRLSAALELSIRLRLVDVERVVRAHMTQLALREGRWDDVKCWQASANISADDLPDFRGEFEYRVLAEVLIAEGCDQEAEALLARLLAAAERSGRAGSALPLSLLYAIVLARQNRQSEAEAIIRRVLPLAESQGYKRMVLDIGPQIIELMCRPSVKHQAQDYVNHLCQAFNVHDRIIAPSHPLNGRGPTDFNKVENSTPIDPLTPREWEILSMIARGASNKEIADRLVLSVGTVKGHVNHIFSKFDVHNRTAAVARARECEWILS